MTRFTIASLLLLLATGCNGAMGLPHDSNWATQDEADQALVLDEGADEADAADEVETPADDGSEDDDDFVPPFPAGDDEDEGYEVCALGDTVNGWLDDSDMHAYDFTHISHPGDLSELELDQLEAGFERWGFFDFNTLNELFTMLEGGRVLVRNVDVLDLDRSFTHLRFHFRGYEFGFLMVEGTDRPVGAVINGGIIDCSVVL